MSSESTELVVVSNAVTATEPAYELFTGSKCHPTLPQNSVVREINFGRFITLANSAMPPAGANASAPEAVILPVEFINPYIVVSRPGRGTPPIPELSTPRAVPVDERPTIEIADVAEVVTRRQVTVGHATGQVTLNSTAITALTRGAAVEVPVSGLDKHTVVLLDASKAKDVAAPVLSNEQAIPDIGAFLARPALIAENGAEVPVQLELKQVRDLMRGHDTQVCVGQQTVRLLPRAATAERSSMVSTGNGSLIQPWGRITASRDLPRAAGFGDLTNLVPSNTVDAPQLGFYVPYRQTWQLLGYSRGALLNSIALAPTEDTTIELFTWDRNTRALEQTSSAEFEANTESVEMTKDTQQVSDELTKDSNFHAEANINANVDVKPVKIGASVGAGGGGSVKDVAKTTTEFIHENTRKASLRVRASRQSKVSESREFGSEQRTTRKIRNTNACHTLNLDYFEVLVNYQVTTTCLRKEAQLVALFDIPEPYTWDRTTLRRFEPTLRAALLDATYAPGFDAARLLAARDNAFKIVCEKCVCADEGSGQVNTEMEELQEAREAAAAVVRIVNGLRIWDNEAYAFDALVQAAPPNPNLIHAPIPNLDVSLHRWMFLQQIQNKAPGVWSGLVAFASSNTQTAAAAMTPAKLKLLNATLSVGDGTQAGIAGGILLLDDTAKQALRSAIYGQGLYVYRDVRQGDLEALKTIAVIGIPEPVTQLITYIVTTLVANAAQQAITAAAAQIGVAAVEAKYRFLLDDMGLMAALNAFAEAYTAWQEALADVLKNAEAAASALEALAGTRNDEIRNAFPLSTVAEARERENALIMHLQDNTTYYAFSVYQAAIGSGAGRLPELVVSSNGLLSDSPMGMVDGKVAFPVNIDLAPATIDATVLAKLRDWVDTEIRENQEIDASPPAPSTISLPTPGIHIETRLGKCDSCESYIGETRAADVRKQTALARQTEAEADRFEQRLATEPPLLDDPTPGRNEPSVAVRLLQPPPQP